MSDSDDSSTTDEIAEHVGDELARDRDQREGLMVEIPSSINDILDKRSEQTGKPKWEIVTEALAYAEGGSDLTTIPKIEQTIEREEQQATDLEREAELKLDKAQDRRDRADALRRRKAKIERKTDARIDALDDVLDAMADRGMHAAVGIGRVPKLATEWFDGDEHATVNALKSRAQEINAGIPPEQFSEPSASTSTDTATTGAAGTELKSLQQLRENGNSNATADGGEDR